LHIVVLCATRRGLAFVQRVRALCPDDQLTVISFREEAHEPPFLDDIRDFAMASGAHFIETRNVAAPQWESVWSAPIDLLFMVHWRYLLPDALVERPQLASVVFHDSLLPAYRGFSPTVWAIINGESEAGVTMLHAAGDVDSGDIIDQERVPIGPDDTIRDVFPRTTDAYLALLERNLPALRAGRAPRRAQAQSLVTYTCKRTPADARISWHQSATTIHNLIRASTYPYPGAFTYFAGRRMAILASRLATDTPRYVGAVVGRVIRIIADTGVVVLTGEGAILITTVQFPDSDPVCAADVIRSIAATLDDRS